MPERTLFRENQLWSWCYRWVTERQEEIVSTFVGVFNQKERKWKGKNVKEGLNRDQRWVLLLRLKSITSGHLQCQLAPRCFMGHTGLLQTRARDFRTHLQTNQRPHKNRRKCLMHRSAPSQIIRRCRPKFCAILHFTHSSRSQYHRYCERLSILPRTRPKSAP